MSGGRQLIDSMILHDIKAVLAGEKARHLLLANPDRVENLIVARREIEAAGKLESI